MQNHASAIRRRLKAKAKTLDIAQNSICSRWTMESFLKRLSISPYQDRFILKGAVMFMGWDGNWRRTTTDVDLEGLDARDSGRLNEIMTAILRQDPRRFDGVQFDRASLTIRTITKSWPSGDRAIVFAKLDTAHIRLCVDIGFGHPITPAPEPVEIPSLLDGFAPMTLQGYPRATMLADKIVTIAEFGSDNTRIRDYYDIWSLTGRNDFDSTVLIQAVRAVAKSRGSLDYLKHSEMVWETGLSTEFARGPAQQIWKNWSQRLPTTIARPQNMEALVWKVREFVAPILTAAGAGETSIGNWTPGKGWSGPPRRRDRRPDA